MKTRPVSQACIPALALTILTATSAAAQNDTADETGPTNYAHRPNTVLKAEDDSLVVRTAGTGDVPVVLIPGHMQDESMYEGLIERNGGAAEFHVVIPPGMAGTPAYPWPAEAEEFIARPWSTRFEEELVRYIDENLDEPPLLLANWYAGLSMALHIADRHPASVRGLLLVGPADRSPYYRWYRQSRDPESRVIYDAEAQRERLAGTIDFWRTVDEFTWHSNMFPAPFYSNDPAAGLRVVYEEAKSPMPVGLRYFAEYMMDDLSGIIPNVDVPVHVVSTIPPEAYFRTQFRNSDQLDMDRAIEGLRAQSRYSWQVDDNPAIDVTVIEESGLMVWHDRPEEFDRVFLGALGGRAAEEDRR
ncbi:MAG: alpha/beta fold hydrolase [Gemmatimonadota bacterium]